MTAVTSWTGIEGVIQVGGSTIAYTKFNLEVKRNTASAKRGASWSAINRPGTVEVTGTITQIMTTPDMWAKLISSTPTTGTAGAALAASEVIKATAGGEYTPFTDTEPTTPSRVKLTLETQPLTVAGTATVFGEDAGGNSIEETFDLPATMVATDYLVGRKVFTKAFGVLVLDADSASDLGTLKVDYIAGDATVTIDAGAEIDVIGSVVSGSNNVTHTCNNCFLTGGSVEIGDADTMIECSYPFVMKDAAADYTFSYVNA